MRVEVKFQDESIEYDVADDRLIGVWNGPNVRESSAKSASEIVREAIEAPRDYPPLRQVVVPGDRVVIALDFRVPETNEVLNVVAETLKTAGVERGDVKVVATGASTKVRSRRTCRSKFTMFRPIARISAIWRAQAKVGGST